MDRKRKKRIDELEERNSELSKEILLNESAIYHVEKEIKALLTMSIFKIKLYK